LAWLSWLLQIAFVVAKPMVLASFRDLLHAL